jgi:hypothetical protein
MRIALVVAGLAWSACTAPLDDGTHCPCVEGYRCDQPADLCRKMEGNDVQVDGGSDTRDADIDSGFEILDAGSGDNDGGISTSDGGVPIPDAGAEAALHLATETMAG